MAIPLLLTIGISGHRDNSRLGDREALRHTIKHGFRRLKELLDTPYGVRFLIISPLAEGADRLFVEALWEEEPQAQLLVPLPFSRERYAQDFSAAGKEEFAHLLADPRCVEVVELPTRGRSGYLEVGKFVVEHADFMFFLHDGSTGENIRDGGTASIIHYTRFDPQEAIGEEHAGKRLPVVKRPWCHINTTSGETQFSVSAEDPFFRNNYQTLLGEVPDRVGEVSDAAAFDRTLEGIANTCFDQPAVKAQHSYYRRILWLLAAAFMTGAFNLLDAAFPRFLMPAAGWLNYDWLELAGFCMILFLALRIRRAALLQRWLGHRYLAERLRHARVYLQAGIPLSRVLGRERGDPAHNDLLKIWHSLFFHYMQQWPVCGKSIPDAGRLREILLAREGLVRSQLLWHRSKALQKRCSAARFRVARYGLLGLSMLLTLLAAFTLGGETAGPAWNLACGLVSLLLAGLAAFAAQKEHLRIAARYENTTRAFAQLFQDIHFCDDHRVLQESVVAAAATLMQTTWDWMRTMDIKDPDAA